MRGAGLLPFCAFVALACSDVATAVESMSPGSMDARGGNVLTVTGVGFTDATTVAFDGVPAATQLISSTELHAMSPALFAGASTVTVVDPSTDAAFTKAIQILPLDLRYVQAPAYVLPAPTKPVTAAVAQDFDGDGDIDVVTCHAGELCKIVLNDGKGNFANPEANRMPGEIMPTSAMVAADFDGDGDQDLFVGFATTALGAFEVNDGHATFSQVPLVTKAGVDPVSAIAAGDLDGDGKIDLVLANTVADSVPIRVVFNRTSGTQMSFVDAALGAIPSGNWSVTSVALGDVDGDGHTDILMATPGSSDGRGMHLFLGHGATFEESALEAATANATTAIAIADLTGDGFADIIAAGDGQDRLLVNDGTGHFFDATTEMMPLDDSLATSVAIVDLDRDRHPDLLIGNSGAVTRLYINDGTGHFRDESPRLSLDSQKVITILPADVDGDGAADVFVFGQDTLVRLFLSVEPLK